MGYMVFTSFAILSVLTGVVCDKMAQANDDHQQFMEEEDAKLKQRYAQEKLEEVFKKLDSDSSGLLAEDEFQNLFEQDDSVDDLCDALDFEKYELYDAWDALSKSVKK